jgi:hypothetical protein
MSGEQSLVASAVRFPPTGFARHALYRNGYVAGGYRSARTCRIEYLRGLPKTRTYHGQSARVFKAHSSGKLGEAAPQPS